MRTLALACALLAALAAGAAGAEPAALNESVVVTSKVVRLGDLFTNAGDFAETPIARAPEPGQRAAFDARWLYRVARGYGLDWRPLSIHDRAVVLRDGHAIDSEEIEDHILAAVSGGAFESGMRAKLSNPMLRLFVAADEEATVGVGNVTYDEQTRRFTAQVWAPADDMVAKRIRVSGRVHRMNEVPVLARRVLAGDVIKENDVTYIQVPTDRLQPNIIVEGSDLIGKTSRRGLRPGVPVSTQDVRRPLLVAKGSLVTMILRQPGMELTTKGRATEDGAEGDTIHVANSHSKTVVEAVVIGANLVTVSPRSQLATN